MGGGIGKGKGDKDWRRQTEDDDESEGEIDPTRRPRPPSYLRSQPALGREAGCAVGATVSLSCSADPTLGRNAVLSRAVLALNQCCQHELTQRALPE